MSQINEKDAKKKLEEDLKTLFKKLKTSSYEIVTFLL